MREYDLGLLSEVSRGGVLIGDWCGTLSREICNVVVITSVYLEENDSNVGENRR